MHQLHISNFFDAFAQQTMPADMHKWLQSLKLALRDYLDPAIHLKEYDTIAYDQP